MKEKRKPKKKPAAESRWEVRVQFTKSVFGHGANGTGGRGVKVTVTDLKSGRSRERFSSAHTKNEARRESEKLIAELKAELQKQR